MDSDATRAPAVFHAGETAIHERLGIGARMREIGQRVIRPFMPDQHRQFYGQLPMLLAGAVDAAGRPWASMLVGRPGFAQAPDDRHLVIDALPVDGDPLATSLQVGAPLGLLGIELHTRRRNRLNGRVRSRNAGGLVVEVEQTVGNCPQYIQGREYSWVRDPGDRRPRAVEALQRLDDEARAFIARADTLFVSTHAPAAAGDGAGGADVSHRGGRAGFVRVESDASLLVPDFAGNNFFMTLGNLQLDARAGLLFVDFESGDLLTLTGRAEVLWSSEELLGFEGAERAWRFRVESGWRLRDALPLRWAWRDWSPQSLLTGSWDDAARRQQAQRMAQTWRPWRVARVVDESRLIRSFHLVPQDDLGLPAWQAGQHLPIRLKRPDGSTLQRTYTISSAPSDGELRLSVKREGAASTLLHEQVAVGDVIEALGPRGQFTIDAGERRPAVLIGAGVGITPMLAFARHLVAEGPRRRRTRPVHLVQVAHDASQRAFGDELEGLAARAAGAMRLHLVLSAAAADSPPTALRGPLTTDLLKTLLPFDDHEFFLCGPPGFMQQLYDGLRELGVRDERIRAEAFGPAALRRRGDAAAPPAPAPALAARAATVVFTRSGISADWSPDSGTLLELAERHGVAAAFGCRAGHCGSCVTRLGAGRVTYAEPTAWRAGDGEVLPCCALPAAEGGERIELDL